MFPRQNRLSREELSKVIKNGCIVHSSLFTLRILDLNENKLKSAFVISKKELKLAVDRNKAKRLARMALREILTHIPPIQFVVFPKKLILTTDFREIVNEFRRSFKA